MSGHKLMWCPLGTCRRCDALRAVEDDAKCPNRNAETQRNDMIGYVASLAFIFGIAALFIFGSR